MGMILGALKDRLKAQKSSLVVLAIFLLGISRSASYIIFGSDLSPNIVRYINLSPYPIAFVHPSFFAKKEVLLYFEDGGMERLQFSEKNVFYQNRINYRTFMFMFDGKFEDRRTAVEYYYCKHLDQIGFPEIKRTPKRVEFVYHFHEGTKIARFPCP